MSPRLFPSRHQMCILSEASRILSTCQFNIIIICKLALGPGLWPLKTVVLQGVKELKFYSFLPAPGQRTNLPAVTPSCGYGWPSETGSTITVLQSGSPAGCTKLHYTYSHVTAILFQCCFNCTAYGRSLQWLGKLGYIYRMTQQLHSLLLQEE